MARNLLSLALCCTLVLLLPTLYFVASSRPDHTTALDIEHTDSATGHAAAAFAIHGDVIMPKLGNETAKAELGRAAWKVLHTMAARYPDEPTEDQRQAYSSFLHLFSRLYPCGECATEFQQLLRKYPPQTSSRKTASMHLCSLHNHVNIRLGKEEFDCTQVEGLYDCGCGPDDATATSAKADEEPDARYDPVTGERLVGG